MSYYYITREKWNRTMVQRSCAYQSRESSRVIVIVAVISIKYEGFNVYVCGSTFLMKGETMARSLEESYVESSRVK